MIEIITTVPQASTFTPLSEHQAETPSSFFASKPILHLCLSSTSLLCSRTDSLVSQIIPSTDKSDAEVPNGTAHPAPEERDQELVTVDVWVTSERLLIWSPSRERGISLQFPDIELHALQRLHLPGDTDNAEKKHGVYLQITNPSAEEEEEEESSITELTIILPPDVDHPVQNGDAKPKPPAEALFEALSACANLHPDPSSSDEEGEDDGDDYVHEGDTEGLVIPGTVDGSLPEPFPGSGGWITAENVGQFFDADGQWLGRGTEDGDAALGPGSGRVRGREELDDVEGGGDVGDSAETKWQRTG